MNLFIGYIIYIYTYSTSDLNMEWQMEFANLWNWMQMFSSNSKTNILLYTLPPRKDILTSSSFSLKLDWTLMLLGNQKIKSKLIKNQSQSIKSSQNQNQNQNQSTLNILSFSQKCSSKGSTALYVAAQNGHFDVVKALVRAYANPDIEYKTDSKARFSFLLRFDIFVCCLCVVCCLLFVVCVLFVVCCLLFVCCLCLLFLSIN